VILPALLCHATPTLFTPLYPMFRLLFRSEQVRLVLVLHHQVLVLQRQLGKRPSLVPGERLALVLWGCCWRGSARLKVARTRGTGLGAFPSWVRNRHYGATRMFAALARSEH